MLVDQAGRYGKGFGIRMLKPLLGEGLLTSEGDVWKRQRRLAQPAFHRERLTGLVAQMAQATTERMARWEAHPPGAPLDLAQELRQLTLSIVARTLFSTDVAGEAERVGRAVTVALEETNRRVLTFLPPPLWVPTARNRAYRGSIRALDAVVLDIIARRRQGQTRGEDLLGMLMEARDADTGQAMSDAQLRDEVMTIFLAGHETTAVALTWTWWLLLEHPEVEARLREEVARVLGGRPPTAADLPRLQYTTRVLEESMRLYPPAWALGREAMEDDVIDGEPVPARPTFVVLMLPWVIHRNPRLWPEPERFDPDRFLPERSQGRPRHAYLPFGAGQRMCIGNNFALMEGVLVLAMMAQRFRLHLVPGQRVEPEPLVTLRPRHGLKVVPVPLHGAATAA